MSSITSLASMLLFVTPRWLHSYVKEIEDGPKQIESLEEVTISRFTPRIHPREVEVSAEVNGYFLKHWPFPNDKARRKFIAAGFSQVTCYYNPLALDDRIELACRLLTLLFLIDGRFLQAAG